MNKNLGVVESQLLDFTKKYRQDIPSVLTAFTYINEVFKRHKPFFPSRL